MTAGTCLAVMYHYVRDTAATPFPTIRALPPAALEQQLDWLEREHTVISLPALQAALDGRAALPPAAALLTFDDGFIDHYETVFPMLAARGLTGTFFLAQDACGPSPRVLPVHKTHFLIAALGPDAFARAVLDQCGSASSARGAAGPAGVFGPDRWEHADERAVKDLLNYELPIEESERVLDALFARTVGAEAEFARALYLGEEMVREMSRAGMTFGYHTRAHRMLSRLTPAAQQAELRDGPAWIAAMTGQTAVPFCYPWGGPKTYTADTLRVLSACGYSLAFNTIRRRLDITRDGRFELPRIDTRDLPPYTAGVPDALAAAQAGEA